MDTTSKSVPQPAVKLDTHIPLTFENIALLRIALKCDAEFEIDPNEASDRLYDYFGRVSFIFEKADNLWVYPDEHLCLQSALKYFLKAISDTLYLKPLIQQVQDLYDRICNATTINEEGAIRE